MSPIGSTFSQVAAATLLAIGATAVVAEPAKAQQAKEVVHEVECGSQTLPIVGEIERVVLEPVGAVLEARIDSGATTSSIDARDIQRYEKDGKPWVRFKVPVGDGEPAEFDLAVVRSAAIKRHGAEPIERPVVELTVRLGELDQPTEFSLADRSSFDFPVLLGRNFLKGRFLVNVARKYHLKTADKRPASEAAK